MVRTKADRTSRKAIGEKATVKKSTPVKINTSKKNTCRKGGKKFYGGSPYPRKTPKWQKSITCFMNTSETSEITVNKASSSKENEDPDIEESMEDKTDETD